MSCHQTTLGRRSLVVVQLVLIAVVVGCQFSNRPFAAFFSDDQNATRLDEKKYRDKYRATQDPTAMRWLLANRIQNGMTPAEVGSVFGESGRLEAHDQWLKNDGGPNRVGDKAYAFGPDSKGQTVYLVFRDNKLVNMDPEDFQSSDPE